MNKLCAPGPRWGSVRIPASKSQAHRLLISAALGSSETTLECEGVSKDILATISCLQALGAGIRLEGNTVFIRPIRQTPEGLCRLSCGESGSTLRFLLPLAGALGAEAEFLREGRLPDRPLAPLDQQLREHGMELLEQGNKLLCRGRLSAGNYKLPGDVSSQFISGLLLSLPLLEGDSSLTVAGRVESAHYIAMTEKTLRECGIRFSRQGDTYKIPGGQRTTLPSPASVEGDWSNAAFFLCMGALSPQGICVRGLNLDSVQGDREILSLLRSIGAHVTATQDSVSVKRGALRGLRVDASAIPDLIPVLSVVAALSEGETRIENAGRLRLKESDRLKSTAKLLRDLGGDVTELPDGLLISGRKQLKGGFADSVGDHRIAMAAAVAACCCTEPVTVCGAESVEKSYPAFWRDWECLEGEQT